MPKLPVTPDLIERAAAIIGADGIADEAMEAQVLALCGDAMLARRLIDWLPEAFALVFVPHLARVNLPTTFSARTSSGKWQQFELDAEPIFPIAVRLGMAMHHAGEGNCFRNIVVRSSLIDAVNKALNQGESLEGATLSGPALNGTPADTYLPRPGPLWRRLFW